MGERSYRVYNRYYCAILYKEDPNSEKYMENIQKYYSEVTYIIHDKDTTEEGEIKKEHIHVLFKVGKNARSIKSVAEQIEIPINYIEGCNKDNMLLYFIHYKKPNKYQYKIEEVKGELVEYMKTLIKDKKSDKEILQEILDYINKYEIKDTGILLHYCLTNNYVNVLRKYSYILTKCLYKY